jgi:transposase
MTKRKFTLPSLDTFQRKLEDFYQTLTAQKQQQSQETKLYMELIYTYHLKGMSLREIAKATEIPLSTVAFWIKKMKKTKTKEQPQDAKAQ